MRIVAAEVLGVENHSCEYSPVRLIIYCKKYAERTSLEQRITGYSTSCSNRKLHQQERVLSVSFTQRQISPVQMLLLHRPSTTTYNTQS